MSAAAPRIITPAAVPAPLSGVGTWTNARSSTSAAIGRTGPSREPDGGAALQAAPNDDDLCASARELGADGGVDVLVASMTSAVRPL